MLGWFGLDFTGSSKIRNQRHVNEHRLIGRHFKSKLPESLKLPMLNAAAVADINLLKNLISSIQHDNEKLAMYLMEIAKNYDYDYMLKLLKNKGE